ncbi:MAG: outer membrane protein [Chthoniobacterales bacterium]
MKKLTLSLLLGAVIATGSAFAGTEAKTFKDKVVVEDTCLFRDTEFQVDAFYSGFYGGSGSKFSTGSGGGLGLNLFLWKYIGFGYEAQWYDNNGTAEHLPLGGSIFLRYPICSINLAPYVMAGGGVAWDGDCIGYGNVGAGLEYRFTKNIGIFADGRYYYGVWGGDVSAANLRAGLRFSF